MQPMENSFYTNREHVYKHVKVPKKVYESRIEYQMCDAHLVVWTCLVYALACGYVLAFAGGYSNMCVCCVLYVGLGVALGFQIASACNMTYVKVGAALFGLMLFTWCGGITERCIRNPSI